MFEYDFLCAIPIGSASESTRSSARVRCKRERSEELPVVGGRLREAIPGESFWSSICRRKESVLDLKASKNE